MTERSRLILASASAARRRLLEGAGIAFDVDPARIDEEALRAAMVEEGLKPRDMADALAELKALRVSARHPGAFVLGADQILSCDGEVYGKAETLQAARRQLLVLRGRAHELHTALVMARDGAPIWRFVDTPKLTMRPFSDDFLEAYLQGAGPDILGSVGCYAIEGRGAQLFTAIAGSLFSVQGLPLLPLLDFLRLHKVIET